MEDQLSQPTQPPEPNLTSVAEIGSLARAVEAERAGRYVEAWTEALKAISLRPLHPEAYIQIASTAVAAGDPEAALRAAQRALALSRTGPPHSRWLRPWNDRSRLEVTSVKRPTRSPGPNCPTPTGSPG